MNAIAESNVMIGTPAYGGMLHSDYVMSVLGFQRERINYTLMILGNESLITRARNTIFSAFVAQPEFTHLLFLDADVHLPADGLRRMLASGRDVVSAAVALKGRNASGLRIFNLGHLYGEDGSLYVVEHVGTAALMLSRKAAEALVADARADGRTYGRGYLYRGEKIPTKEHYDVFRTGVVNGDYLSEDYWVCGELRRLGFAIHLDPTILTRHSGMIET